MPVVIDEVQVEAAAQRGEAETTARAPSAPRPVSRSALRELMRREAHRRERLEAD